MTGVVERQDLFHKSLPNKSACEGRRIASVSRSLSAADVPTPAGTFDVESHALIFPWVQGRESRDWIRQSVDEGTDPEWIWPLLMKPLTRLHEVDLRELNLHEVDPFAHITRRLHPALDEVLNFPVSQLYNSLFEAVAQVHQYADVVVVHGDFHVGQVLIDKRDGHSVLVDLDDAGHGYREQDVGNLVAHLISSPPIAPALSAGTGQPSDTCQNIVHWLTCFAELYLQTSGHTLERSRLLLFAACALLRRALKLHEYQTPDFRVRKVLELSADLHSTFEPMAKP